MKSICCVAGRSGGHIIPCLSYAQVVGPEQEVLLFTSNSKLDTTITKNFKKISKQIILPLENIPYKNLFRWPIFLWQLIHSMFLSMYHLIKHRPSVIISTGGYISVPVCLVGKLLGIKVELFELNVIPGKAIAFLAPFASVTNICFPETEQYLKRAHCKFTLYPLKPALKSQQPERTTVLESIGLSPTQKTILILGGSQGSQSLNNLFLNALQTKSATSWQVMHQVGNSDPQPFKDFYKKHDITAFVFQFHGNLETLYPASDLVVCRSGAGTLFETLYFKKRCITVPLKATTTNHQVDNARSFATQYPELFTMIQQETLEHNPAFLYTTIKDQLSGQ